MNKGKFIIIEGQGFTGKTTQAKLLAQKLREKGVEVEVTREPGGVPEAEEIRTELLKRREEGSITPEEEVKLFYKSRKIFLEKLVKPSLEEGKWIISTRFSPSTFVYQGAEGGVPTEFIEKLDREVVGNFQPDLYILLDVPEEEILKRLQATGTRERHGYNENDPKIIKTRREAYLNLAHKNFNGNWEITQANGNPAKVADEIWNKIVKLI